MNALAFASSISVGALLLASPGFSQYDRTAADKVYKVEQPTSGKVGSLEWTLVAGRGGAAPNFPGGGNQGGGRAAAAGGGNQAGGRGGGGGFPGGGGRGRG